MAFGAEDEIRRRVKTATAPIRGQRGRYGDVYQLRLPFEEASTTRRRGICGVDTEQASPDPEHQANRRHGRGDENGRISIEFSPLEPSALIAEEAIRYLRLDVGKSAEASRASLDRLVEKGLLRPCMYRKERMFTRAELDRFLAQQTEQYGDV